MLILQEVKYNLYFELKLILNIQMLYECEF